MINFIATALGFVKFVPTLIKWLSEKNAEHVASDIINIAKKVTQCSTSEEAIHALAKNSLLASDFQEEVLKMETKWELSLLEDRQQARERDLEILRTGHANRRADLMVVSAALGLVMCLLSLAFYSDVLPGEAVGIISTIAGIFGGCLKDAFAFEFGSSRGSKVKDSTVASILEKLN